MSGDHNQHQKDKSYLDGMDRYKQVRELVKDPSLRIKDIVELTGYDKGHVSRLRKASQQFECPRCGHCCLSLVDAYDTSQERVDEKAKREQEPVAWISDSPTKGNGRQLHWTKAEAWRWSSNIMPLYTAPPKREWVGLTDEQVEDEWERITGHSIFGGDRSEGRAMYISPDEVIEFSRAIESKLKERNK